MALIVFFSTGRCGTQFATHYLAHAAGERAVVVHEPIGAKYAPRQTLRAPDLDQAIACHPAVDQHFAEIARITAAGQTYVETGWPMFSWIELFLERFRSEVLVVHVTRHPVDFAFSLASHGFFSWRRAQYARLAELDPTSPGVKHHHYAGHWETLNPAEKSMFQWLEINTLGEELKAAHADRFVTVRAEDLFTQPELLLRRMIERRPPLAEVFPDPPTPLGVVDRWPQRRHRLEGNFKSLRYPPEVLQLAQRYGYSMEVNEVGVALSLLVDRD